MNHTLNNLDKLAFAIVWQAVEDLHHACCEEWTRELGAERAYPLAEFRRRWPEARSDRELIELELAHFFGSPLCAALLAETGLELSGPELARQIRQDPRAVIRLRAHKDRLLDETLERGETGPARVRRTRATARAHSPRDDLRFLRELLALDDEADAETRKEAA